MFCTTEKEILVMVIIQIILLIPLKVKLQALEYRGWWWNPFLDKQLTLGYWEKSVVDCSLSKSSTWQYYTLKKTKKIVIEGISYLVKYWVLTLAPLSLEWLIEWLQLLQGSSNLKKVMQYKTLSIKSKDLGWRSGP